MGGSYELYDRLSQKLMAVCGDQATNVKQILNLIWLVIGVINARSQHDIVVIVENHGGLSSNGQWLTTLMKRVNLPNCGTLPDFGNFDLGNGQQYDRYQGVAEMMPYAKAVSAKCHDFDATGNETHTDYRRMLKIVKDARYRGFLGIEYEGDRLGEADGVRATKALLEKVRAELG